MRQALKIHPDSRSRAVTRIDVNVVRQTPGRLMLHYLVTGKIADVRLPPVTAPKHADGLWQHTCFEAFLRAAPGEAYCEFNFSPSTQWAAYRFDRYRSGMRDASEATAPHIEVSSNDASCEMRVSLALDGFTDLPDDARWQLGLSAVIEETSGARSYWALAHPPGKADFHHADCFALQLSPP